MKNNIKKENPKKSIEYLRWLKSDVVSEELKEQMRKMNDEDVIAAFNDSKLIFGTAGIRGLMGPGTQRMNEFVYAQIATGYAKFINTEYKNSKEKYVVIGHDNRRNSDKFAEICAKVLTQHKINVLLFENNTLMPTPLISYAIRQINACGGIIVTASHNPKEYNGFKAYNHKGAQILKRETDMIVNNMPKICDILDIKVEFEVKYLNYIAKEIVNLYFNDLKNVIINKKTIKNQKKFKIVFTGHHGTTSKLLPAFLNTLNYDNVYPLAKQCTIDSEFTNSPISNPEDPKSFDDAIKYADKINANIVIGCDPDGDRMAIGFRKFNQWRFMNGNEMGIIYTYYCLKHAKYDLKPYIISSWVSTNYIDRIAKKYNADVIRTKTGFKWMGNIIDDLNKNGSFVVAFEEAIGALNSTINRDKDSFGATALALEIFDHVFKKYNDLEEYLVKEIYEEFGYHFTRTDSFVIKSSNWTNDAKKLMKKILAFKKTKLDDYKIKRVWFNKNGDCGEWTLDNDSWIRFRISGTEPKFKVYYCLNGQRPNQLHITWKNINEIIEKEIINKKK